MLPTIPVSVATEVVRDLQGQDSLCSLWIVLTKCTESVQDGPRLENISWQLWYRELIHAQVSCRSSTSDLALPHPKGEQSRSSHLSAHTNQKVSLELQVISSGLPSHSDQASPSPSPSRVPTTVPPPAPEHPRMSLHGHSSGMTAPLSSSTRGKLSTGVGHSIVDLLQNQFFTLQRKLTSTATTTAVLPTPPPAVQPSRSSDLGVPLVQLPTPTQTPFHRDVIVNSTPLPNPPVAPILHGDTPGAPQLPPAFLLPHLPPATLQPMVFTAEVHAQQQARPPLSLISREPSSSHTLVRQSDCRIFLQQSPTNPSPERGGVSTASGKSPSDLFEASSTGSSQVKSALTDADVDDDNKEDKEREQDRQPTTTAVGAGARHPACGRQKKLKKERKSEMRPLVKRPHLARHLALSTIRKLSAQQQQHQHPGLERAEAKVAVLNIGSGSLNASRPAKGSAGNANGNANANTQSRKTIIVASTSSEEFERMDGEDSEDWASEDMDPEDEVRKEEETQLHEAALEAQRQRELFAKVPKCSYSNLNRPQSGLLSQLMNPSPVILPPNHPHRISRSSANISRQHQQHGPVLRKGSSAYAPPQLSTSMAALPLAVQITAASSSRPPTSSVIKQHWQEKGNNRYRPRGPPEEQEMEDGSGDDADGKIHMSQSVAHQRLQALISCQSSKQGMSSHFIRPAAMDAGPDLLSSADIPLGHPYNLPAAAPPMTPRTTRRRMLETELSESMRRQLLWERQVNNNTNLALAARRARRGIGGLRPLTSTSSEDIEDMSTRSTEAQDKDERWRRAIARYRIWADDYHW